MMHSEMELVENIKQSEENVDTVNGRIEQFKARTVLLTWLHLKRGFIACVHFAYLCAASNPEGAISQQRAKEDSNKRSQRSPATGGKENL